MGQVRPQYLIEEKKPDRILLREDIDNTGREARMRCHRILYGSTTVAPKQLPLGNPFYRPLLLGGQAT